MFLVVDRGRAEIVGELVAPGKSIPRSIDACKTTMVVVIPTPSPSHQVVEVSRSPGEKAKCSDTEESVQDLGIDFNPNLPCGRIIFTVGVTHGGSSFEKNEEDHGTPGNDVETVYGDEESKRR